MLKIGPFVGIGDVIGLVVGIGPVVGIGLFGGTGLVVSLTYMRTVRYDGRRGRGTSEFSSLPVINVCL